MTPEDKKVQMDRRNTDICAYYEKRHTLAECASFAKLGRQRVAQILQAGGVWRPYVKTDRTKFLGVTVSEQTKDALTRKADKQGVSTSRLTSDILDEAVR